MAISKLTLVEINGHNQALDKVLKEFIELKNEI
jgi:hypothetical protein